MTEGRCKATAWRFTRNNAFTEGSHTKMEVLRVKRTVSEIFRTIVCALG
jgi:hypothetical protein